MKPDGGPAVLLPGLEQLLLKAHYKSFHFDKQENNDSSSELFAASLMDVAS